MSKRHTWLGCFRCPVESGSGSTTPIEIVAVIGITKVKKLTRDTPGWGVPGVQLKRGSATSLTVLGIILLPRPVT